MIEDTKAVKTITSKAGGKTGTYWTVTWQDGKSNNVFIPDWIPLLEQSQKTGCLVHFTKEQTSDGKYYNVKSMELVPLSDKPNALVASQDGQGGVVNPLAGAGQQPIKTEMTKDDWKERDRITRQSIERQTALNAAVELAKNAKAEITTADIIRTAHQFVAFLAGVPPEKEVQSAKGLVEEARKLGATEIKKEGG